jgi:hypothetical protein
MVPTALERVASSIPMTCAVIMLIFLSAEVAI